MRTARMWACALENAPFTEEEKAAIGSGNWERLTGHLAADRGRHRPA